MKILISGASGLTGTALTRAFREEGHTVSHFVRPRGATSLGSATSPRRAIAPGDVAWDPTRANVDVAAMEGADAVIHLSGASIGEGRWTSARKDVLRSSRVDSTRLLVDALGKLRRKPRVFMCASAIGFYGNRGDEILTEASERGTGFLALLARDWEAEAMRAEASGIRTVLMRFGVILSAEGGALPRMIVPFKLGVGGRLGSGRQWMSWIALEDAVGIIRAMILDEGFRGAVNVVAPEPARNAEFTRVLARVLHRAAIFPAPAFALRMALGEMADSLLLVSQRVLPERLAAAGYAFRYAELESALRAILENTQGS
jgi:uncharacterized protein (TIGR01777 family)